MQYEKKNPENKFVLKSFKNKTHDSYTYNVWNDLHHSPSQRLYYSETPVLSL